MSTFQEAVYPIIYSLIGGTTIVVAVATWSKHYYSTKESNSANSNNSNLQHKSSDGPTQNDLNRLTKDIENIKSELTKRLESKADQEFAYTLKEEINKLRDKHEEDLKTIATMQAVIRGLSNTTERFEDTITKFKDAMDKFLKDIIIGLQNK